MKFNLSTENINYIKLNYIDSENTQHCIKAPIKHLGESEILISTKPEHHTILFPQDVIINFICEDGLYTAQTKLISTKPETPYLFFIIKKPDNIEYKQNREYFRIKSDESVIVNYGGKVIAAKIHDISANGIKIITDYKIIFPEVVTIEILYSPNSLKLRAGFVRTDEEDGVAKSSFRFINIPQSAMDIISQKCIQKQLENKRNSLKNRL